MKKILLFAAACLIVLASVASGADDPLTKLENETMQFFRPVSGKVVSAEGSALILEVNTKDPLTPGMRLNILKEGEPFRHPVTREVLGKIETLSGKAEVRDVQGERITAAVVEGDGKEGDRVRISETKIKMVFVQDKKVDWYLGDDLYRRLKTSNRIEMIDTGLDTDDEKKVVEEAKKLNADVALFLTAKEADKGTLLREQLFWVSDGSRFFDTEVKIDVAFSKDLKFGEEYFAPLTGEAIFKYDLPFSARLIATGDFDGDGKQEIALSTSKGIRTYLPAVDLQPLWELKSTVRGDHVWIDALDVNGNGRDELIITIMQSGGGMPDKGASDSVVSSVQPGEVISLIYELAGTEFKKIWEAPYFLRKVGSRLIGQMYSVSEGFKDDVFTVLWDGEFKRGEKVKLPKGITIYDFVYLEGPSGERALLTYDEKGFLNIFDDRGIRIWRSSTDTGGFLTTFKKPAPASYVEAGSWSIKDRMTARNRDVLVVQRVPFVEMAKGAGYKSSRIKSYWWNGFSMEERMLIDDVPGTLLDYALAGDKVVVLASPFLGIKFENILKGESPLGVVLYIYSVKGR
jgi:hypothetical protein